MSEELRLAVTVEADLSKLDMSLANALQKVSTAGSRMQQAARFDISNGGGGTTASQSFPTGGDGFKGVTGYNSVSFGRANIVGGNGNFPPHSNTSVASGVIPPGGAPNMLASVVGNLGVITAGIGAIVEQMKIGTAGFSAASSVGTAIRNYGVGGNRVSNLALAGAEQSLRGIPFIGGIAGSAVDFQRGAMNLEGNALRSMGFGFGNNAISNAQSPGEKQAISDRIVNDLGQTAINMGRGGAYSKLSQYDLDKRQDYDQLALDKNSLTSAQYNNRRLALDAKFKSRFDNIQIDRRIDISDIQSKTKQLGLRAAGMGGFADIENINQSFRDEIAGTSVVDQDRINLLKEQQKAAVMASMFANIGPGQEISPTNTALGPNSVRMGSLSGQDPDIKSQLNAIISGVNKDPPPVVGRQ